MRRLYFRIYLAVLASLIVFALAAGLLWRTLGEWGGAWQGGEMVSQFAQNILPPASTDKAGQQAALEKISAGLRADVSLFAADRSRLAVVGEPLPAPEAEFEHGMFSPRMRGRPAWTVRLPDGRWLVARREAMDRVVGLEMGADDYLPKPFEPRELLARLRAILRRGRAGVAADVLRFGRLEIDRGARAVRVDGVTRELTSHQFALLLALGESAGRVLSREALMEKLKGEPLEAFDRSIDVHISRIRAAIEDDAKRPRRIVTVRGSGYVFARQQD